MKSKSTFMSVTTNSCYCQELCAATIKQNVSCVSWHQLLP